MAERLVMEGRVHNSQGPQCYYEVWETRNGQHLTYRCVLLSHYSEPPRHMVAEENNLTCNEVAGWILDRADY